MGDSQFLAKSGKIFVCFVALFILSVSGDDEAVASGVDKPAKIAIIGAGDFVPDSSAVKTDGLPDGLVARISERLTASKRFTLLERKALRRVILEQRFGQKRPISDVDRLLEKAVSDLKNIEAGTLYEAGEISSTNDALKDFQDLGTAAGADYIVYAKLEKLKKTPSSSSIPYSDKKNKVTTNTVDVRLYLRVIDSKNGHVVGADSIKTEMVEQLFEGKKSTLDNLSIYDKLGLEVSGKILDMIFPVRIIGDNPYIINRGKNDGVKVGDRYDIVREGKEIKNSNGTVLGSLRSSVGKIKLTQVQDRFSVIEVVEGTIQKDDFAISKKKATEKSEVIKSAKVGLKGNVGNVSAQKPRIAIGLVKSGSTARTGKKADEHIPQFTDTIISRLSQTKRFQLIDRQEVDQLLNEQLAQAMAENRPMPSAMGTLEGADYLVYGSIASFSIDEKVLKLPGSNKSFKSKVGYVKGNMRIVDARSGDILASSKISVKEKLNSNSKSKRLASLLADAYAEQVVLNLMSAIYPIKVAAFTADGTIYINRGNDGGLYIGEKLTAYRPGQAVIDPDTGIQLGVSETVLGEVTVFEVENARSKGSSATELRIGDILKRSVNNKNKRTSVAGKQIADSRSGATVGSAYSNDAVTIAVGKIKLNRKGKNSLLSGDAINRVTDDLIIKLSQNPRFDVMERQQVDQLIGEKEFNVITQGGDIELSLKKLVGADYFVYGTINDFYINAEKKHIAVIDEVETTNKGVVEANLRIVDVHTGKIVSAEKIRLNEKLGSIKDKNQAIGSLLDRFTTQIVSNVVSRLYPNDIQPSGFKKEKPTKDVRKINRPNF